MHETYDSKGLTVLSVTGEPRERVDPWVEQWGAIYPIFCEGGGQLGSYQSGGVPTAYLIAADGKIVWHGHPGNLKDSEIEDGLKKVDKAHRVSSWAFLIAKALPPVPKSLAAAQKLLVKMKFGGALKKVESTLARLEGEDKEAGEAIRAWIEGVATRGLEKAAELVREGQVYKGYLQYAEIEERFKGHDLGKQAKVAAKALKSDKEQALEIKASEKLEKAKKEMATERKPEDQLKCLKPLLGKKYAETLAGKEAAKIAKELEAKID